MILTNKTDYVLKITGYFCFRLSHCHHPTLTHAYTHTTLMQLVSLISWSMSNASPLSLAGSCCRTMPSPAQLYRLKVDLPSAAPTEGRRKKKKKKGNSLVVKHILICFQARQTWMQCVQNEMYPETQENSWS